jgi:hypothetical protein
MPHPVPHYLLQALRLPMAHLFEEDEPVPLVRQHFH